jgi:hypothetical protein
MAQDDHFQEEKRCKWHISNNTMQTAKKLTKPLPTSTAVKLPPKAALTHNFLAPLRTTVMKQRKHYLSRRLPKNQAGHH